MPADPRTQKESDETLHSSRGPHPPARESRRPEDNYPAIERQVGTNRTDAAAPGGPVNIGVKGGAPEADPAQAREETPKATGGGRRDSTAGLPEA
jgi:hypothetical protein